MIGQLWFIALFNLFSRTTNIPLLYVVTTSSVYSLTELNKRVTWFCRWMRYFDQCMLFFKENRAFVWHIKARVSDLHPLCLSYALGTFATLNFVLFCFNWFCTHGLLYLVLYLLIECLIVWYYENFSLLLLKLIK